ncbi:MAG TPA: M1 family metallopeptidase [Candidatus Bathyarchaeia archaeon]|nr:M1 family metallopeptidase [Candidatus Bathyarchaeia archaeon]
MNVKTYDLFIELDFQNLKYEAKELVEIESDEDVVLNSSGLQIKKIMAEGSLLRFRQDGEDLAIETGPFRGVLEIEFTGSIPDALTGIYKAPYDGTYMITTQFEAIHARRMFPCVDHPAYKAEFKLAVRIDRDLDAISNMPIESAKEDGGKKTVSFQKTPRMSTYLLYLGVGKFEEIKGRVGDTDVIAASTPMRAGRGQFALDIAIKSIDFYESYFGLPYSLPKVHLIAVPEFAAGAMENWGAVTFRETAMLVDKGSSVKARKRVAEVVAHELAHMWVGDLVTMKWWNEIWLNESFATFMAYKVVDSANPEWRIWEEFLNSEASLAMGRDALRNTHPIEVDIKSPSEIEEVFDDISYSKGACMLRMIEDYVGGDGFRRGVSSYLSRYKFQNAVGDDLWSSLEETSGRRVKEIMEGWVRKPGYPLVSVSMKGENLTMRQERFLLSGEHEKGTWPIPINMELNGEPKQFFMDTEEMTIEVETLKSLKMNIDRKGLYRVLYKGLFDSVWQADLSPLDRWGIVSDAFAFLVSQRISFSDYLAIIERFMDEKEDLPAREVSDQLSLLNLITPSKVAETSRRFHALLLKRLESREDENGRMLRGIAAGRLVMVDDAYSRELGAKFLNYDAVEPDLRDAVASAFARGFGDFDPIIKRYRESVSDEEKIRMLAALTSFKDSSLVALSFGLALSGEVKRQDVRTMIVYAVGNPDGRDVVWTWMKANIEKLKEYYSASGALSRMMPSILPLLGIGKAADMERFFNENPIPEAETGIRAGLEKLRIYDRLASGQGR